jgi:phytoene dehydrogenase-like protein
LDKKKIIIIGGGVAGLSTGIYGQLSGFETRIFEMHHTPGGQCTAWDRKGYRFDYCLHWLVGTRSSAFHEIWKETNVINDTVKIVNGIIHSVFSDEKWGEFILYANIDQWQEYLISLAPEDTKGIRKMCGHMRAAAGFEPMYDPPSLRSPMVYLKIFLKNPVLLIRLNRFSKITAKTYFRELGFKNLKLVYFLNKIFGEINFSALVVVMMLGWFHIRNTGYLVGGSLAIASRMAERYRELGGNLLLKRKVEKILVENDKAVGVQLTDGSIWKADFIISAADGHTTLFEMLGGKYLTRELEKAYSDWELYKPFVQLSVGVNSIVQSKAVSATYYKENLTIGGMKVRYGYSIMNQSMHDSTFAPEGKTSLVLRFDSDWENWENMDMKTYEDLKKDIEKEGLAIVESHYPEIHDNVEVTDVATPLTNVKYTGVWKGAYEGFMPTGNMIKKTMNNTIPGLKSFYMVGQWMFPGGGLPPAAQSGKWAIQEICSLPKSAPE